MFVHNINPVFLSIGPFQIRYYGLVMALGVLLGIFAVKWLAKKKKLKISEENLFEALFYMVFFGFLGARIDSILLHNPMFYLKNPFEIIAVWHGGFAAHGAFLGGFLALYFYCKKKKISLYQILDLVVIPLSIGLAFGRIANFINGELYGRITSVPWAVKFPGVDGFRHPSQLYESLKNFIIFFVLLTLTNSEIKKKRHKDGFIFWTFMLLYSVLRFIVEFFREPDISFLGLNLGQITSIIIAVVAIPFLIKLWPPEKNEKPMQYKKKGRK